MFKNKLPSEIKSELGVIAARVCSNDLRPFSLFNGPAFKSYCQELINLGATIGKLNIDKIGPDRKTVKKYTMQNAEDLKEIMIKSFKSIKALVVSKYE